jgi:hypothetical protein
MKNRMEDLRNHLFESIEMLKSGEMEVAKAMAINNVAQTLVASAKVEVDYIRQVGDINSRSVFIEGNQPMQPMRLVKN